MRDELYRLQAAATNLNSYLYQGEAIGAKVERKQVMDLVHAVNMAYGAWAWDVDKEAGIEVD